MSMVSAHSLLAKGKGRTHFKIFSSNVPLVTNR